MSDLRAGLPVDPAQWAALAAGVVVLVALRRWPAPSCDRRFVAVAAAIAAILSGLYVDAYLRGGPRIIDATSYFLEARALAGGQVSWTPEVPLASVAGRFLVQSPGAEGTAVAVLFPPGYPALLAVGFAIGAPLLVGPLLAALIVLATVDLARVASEGARDEDRRLIVLVAASWSVACAVLRYHTADTMSHGLSALCFAVALSFALRGARGAPLTTAVVTGGALGALAATRPVSALACSLIVGAVVLARRPPGSKRWASVAAVSALPLVGALVLQQWAATGAAFSSSQRAYYAQSDGPAGCFRYGFGEGVGCLFEHGDFVRHNLPSGYGAYEALATTLRRLEMHLADAGNAEPMFALVLAGAVVAARHASGRWLALAGATQVAMYAPFYFDGNYPGGGARLFADVLPLEHVLAGFACAGLARRLLERSPTSGARAWVTGAFLALPLAGFAFRGGFEHAALRDREGGRPMYDPRVLERAGVEGGIVLVDTDHGFNLGHDPRARAPGEIEVLRYRGDDLDVFAAARRGAPLYRYRYDFATGEGSVERLLRRREGRVEGESLWPAREQRRGHASPSHDEEGCASGGQRLTLHPDAGGRVEVVVSLPEELREERIAPRVWLPANGAVALVLTSGGDEVHRWRIATDGEPRCETLSKAPTARGSAELSLEIESEGAAAWGLDTITYATSE